jgi:glycyl-tRNA synthetase alpha subunit
LKQQIKQTNEPVANIVQSVKHVKDFGYNDINQATTKYERIATDVGRQTNKYPFVKIRTRVIKNHKLKRHNK